MDDLLEQLAQGRITVEEARRRLARDGLHAVDDLALFDAERRARTGLPEVVLAEGKSPVALQRIVRALLERCDVLVSRLDPELLRESGLDTCDGLEYDEEARFACLRRRPDAPRPAPGPSRVAVVTAGTADLPVAREAVATLQALGVQTHLWSDRGVAAPARLAPTVTEVLDWGPDVVVVAAGREGTLATLVAGLVPVPVVGLPVSSGYGHGGRGSAALATMLQSCTALSVVNIDAGVVAGLVAGRIAMLAHPERPGPKEPEAPTPQGSGGPRAALRGRQY